MLVFRSDMPLALILPSVTAAINASNPLIKTGRPRASDETVAGSRETQLFTLRLIGAFAALALLLAAVGLHATISYSVGTRTREIGIRLALGAQSQNLMELIVGQGIRLTLAGVALGALGGFLAGRTMRALLYQVTPADPATILVVGAILVAVAIIASYAPARRAVRVDPAETLRAE
jgi:putative ABC transport system permease protein